MRTALLKARKDKGYTQLEVAEKAGIDRSYYVHIERGNRTPSFKVAMNIANILGKRVDEIFLPSDVADGHNEAPTGTTG